ncbi:AarF/ABC1/UbiB kinase family protein [Candidatus Venteria ishoeyi]|uniref:ABC1 kinase family protein n=1 Tax=Candidatus Venteria ishoeyi TaxID=1899563 RepID=UPI0025A54343|nr:AarF/ABC1/UbiB kinase family protein [Candidatus Venteria ishoeyi]MDM8545681.1 AarF/ABC1/UbiB kinase family protein [Candidatus Venteria ishoeyi]
MSTVNKVYTSLRGISSVIKDIGRLREILSILIKHGFGVLITRLRLVEVIGVKNLSKNQDDANSHYSTSQRIRMALEELGPTFIKLGQILSTRPDLASPELIKELQQLQDQVPELPFEQIQAQIETELGQPLAQLFSEFDRRALACASIAQVHRAVLAREKIEVAVKVQRPELTNRIERDLNILYFLARRSEVLAPDLALIDPVGIVHEFEKAIYQELDANRELTHLQRFQEHFAAFPEVKIPIPYPQYCSQRILTLEFIYGVKITLAPKQFQLKPEELGPRLMRVLFRMIFQNGFFHGDLHPGNILVQADGRLVLLDFGMAGRLSRPQRDHILDVMIGISQQDYALVARAFYDIGIKMPGASYDYAAFEHDVILIMSEHFEDRTLGQIEIGQFFMALVRGAIAHNIRMPSTYTLLFKALMTVEGITKNLMPNLNFIEEAQPLVQEVLAQRYHPRRMLQDGGYLLLSMSKLLRQFPDTARQLLHDAEQGRLSFRVELKQWDCWLEEQRNLRQSMSLSVGFGASIIAASLALDSGPEGWFGLNMPSLVLYGIGGILGFLLLLRHWR